MLCKYCNQDLDLTHFYKTNKVRCKACIKAAKQARNGPCPVPGCLEIIDFRAKLCPSHAHMAHHQNIDPEDLEALSKAIRRKDRICPVPGCTVNLHHQSDYCSSHAQIAHCYPEYSLEDIANHVTREKRVAENVKRKSALKEAGLKVCSKCKETKPKGSFSKEQKYSWCKECCQLYNNDYYHRVQKNDPNYKLYKAVSKGVRYALAKAKTSKGKRVFDCLPYTIDQLKVHLEAQFAPEMNWDNYGSYWVIDHVVPQAFFSFTSIEDPPFKVCWGLDNLRPLQRIDNAKKSSTFSGKLWTYQPGRWT